MVEVSNSTLTNAVHFLVFFCISLEKKKFIYLYNWVCMCEMAGITILSLNTQDMKLSSAL